MPGKGIGVIRTAYDGVEHRFRRPDDGRPARFGQSAVIADADPRPADETASVLVRFEGLGKRFEGSTGPVVALEDVSFQVRRGEIFGIIGRSGAGKSTLIRCVNRLERPSSGRVTVDEQDVGTLSDKDLAGLRQRIGMIFQHFNLMSSKTVFENVALPLRFAGRTRGDIEETVRPLLDLVGLADKRDVYPAKLSGGQKQRVGIARALVHGPDILLCDEATSALDPETTLSILQLLKDINRRLGLTIILITHEMSVIREICDRVVVLEAGRVVEEGAVSDVFARPQAAVTQRFLKAILPDLPSFIAERVAPEPDPESDWDSDMLLRVRFSGESARDPVISELALAFDLTVTLVHGGIDYIQTRPFGNLVISAPYRGQEALSAILDFLRARDVQTEVIGYVPRPH